MSQTAIIVGSVPDIVESVLQKRGYDVTRVPLTARPDPSCDLAVVAESPDAAGKDAVEEWLATLEEESVVTVFQAPWFDDDRIVTRLIAHQVTNVIEGDSPTADSVDAVIALAEGTPVGPLHQDDLQLGVYYRTTRGQDTRAYERRRSLSMVTPSMRELVNDINFAVQRMVGSSEGTPWSEPPFDPFDRVTSRLVVTGTDRHLDRGTGRPRLSDLYSLPKDATARDMLGATASALEDARRTHQQATMALIRGESGSGKTLAASLMWRSFAESTAWAKGDPAKMPFVKVNCGGMTASNFDHLMLGTGPGQWSGVDSQVGHFGRADYGMLFLDEIGDMDPTAQSRFKPVLDDLIIEPPGLFAYPLHTRVVAATNVELESAERGFQHDLLRRFNIQLRVPGLNERSDAEKLQQIDFVAQLPTINPWERDATTKKHRLMVAVIDAAVIDALLDHDWSHGNFRELQEVVQGAVTAARKRRSPRVERRDLTFSPKSNPGDERVVNVAAGDLGHGRPAIHVRSRQDLIQASRLLGRPIFRAPDGSESVLTQDHLLVLPPGRPGDQASGSGANEPVNR